MLPSQKQQQLTSTDTSDSNINLRKTGQNNKTTVATTPNAIDNKTVASNGIKAPFLRKQSAKDREKEKNERAKIVLWRHPILTVKYCTLEVVTLLQTYGRK